MTYIVGRNFTYFIGGSNDNSAVHSDVQITPFTYCTAEDRISDSGNMDSITPE